MLTFGLVDALLTELRVTEKKQCAPSSGASTSTSRDTTGPNNLIFTEPVSTASSLGPARFTPTGTHQSVMTPSAGFAAGTVKAPNYFTGSLLDDSPYKHDRFHQATQGGLRKIQPLSTDLSLASTTAAENTFCGLAPSTPSGATGHPSAAPSNANPSFRQRASLGSWRNPTPVGCGSNITIPSLPLVEYEDVLIVSISPEYELEQQDVEHVFSVLGDLKGQVRIISGHRAIVKVQAGQGAAIAAILDGHSLNGIPGYLKVTVIDTKIVTPPPTPQHRLTAPVRARALSGLSYMGPEAPLRYGKHAASFNLGSMTPSYRCEPPGGCGNIYAGDGLMDRANGSAAVLHKGNCVNLGNATTTTHTPPYPSTAASLASDALLREEIFLGMSPPAAEFPPPLPLQLACQPGSSTTNGGLTVNSSDPWLNPSVKSSQRPPHLRQCVTPTASVAELMLAATAASTTNSTSSSSSAASRPNQQQIPSFEHLSAFETSVFESSSAYQTPPRAAAKRTAMNIDSTNTTAPPSTVDLASLGGGCNLISGIRKWTARYEIQVPTNNSFQVTRKIIGVRGCNMKSINELTGAKLRLRGRGSGYLEGLGHAECEDPLHLCISSCDERMYALAKKQSRATPFRNL